MNYRNMFLVAACLSVAAGVPILTQAVGDTTPMANSTPTMVTLPDGITPKNLNSDRSIEKAFKAVTEDAMSKTGFDNLVGCLVDQDRDRITKSLSSGSLNNINGSKNQKLTDIIASIDGGWKLKYNQSFNIDIAKVYTADFIHIQTGEVEDASKLVGKWPVQVSLMSPSGGTLSQSDADLTKSKTFGGDINLEKGRDVAVVQFQNSSTFSGLNASMIHEVASGWKFDVPNTLDAVKLYDNVVTNLTTLDKSRAQWPDDVNEAYRRFTQAVVAALYDAPYPGDLLHRAPGAAAAN
jgi:hypothetical protein